MSANIRRLFGIKTDALAGGSPYDILSAGAIADVDTFYPVTGGTLDKNINQVTRGDEVRGRRPQNPPLPFRSNPVMTIPFNLYRSIFEKFWKKTAGGTDTVTGSAPSTHTIPALGFGTTQLPASFAQLIRDDLNHKMSGAFFESLSINAPLDGIATGQAVINGLYYKNDPVAAPTATFATDGPIFLRDAKLFIDGSGTGVPDLQGIEFSFTNNTTPKWYAGKNVVSQTLGTPALLRKVWYPQEMKLGSAQDVTYAINLGNVNIAQELAQDFTQIQKFVFELWGDLVGASQELIRITCYNAAHGSAAGAEALNARDDITARFEGGAFYSDADAADIKVEIVSASAVVIT